MATSRRVSLLRSARPTRVHVLERSQVVHRSPEEVFEFFARPANLEAITPPWLRFRMLTPADVDVRDGVHLEYVLRIRGIALRWVSRIESWQPPRRFVDRQLRGPYRSWEHTHEVEPHVDGALVTDRVRYALPFGRVGELAHALVRRDLERIFDHRRTAVARLLG